MKINSVNIPEEITSNYGLPSIQMSKLSNVVIIAGKNGAGKTRFFTMLQGVIEKHPTAKREQSIDDAMLTHKQRLGILKYAQQNAQATKDKKEEQQLAQSIAARNKEIMKLEREQANGNYLSFNAPKEDTQVTNFVPRSLGLIDSYDITEKARSTYARNIYTVGIDNLSSGVIPAIHTIQHRFTQSQVAADLEITPEEKTKIEADYYKLKEYINTFLGTDLARNIDGQPLLFGERIGQANLSDGQKILLQFCLAIYAQESLLENLVIFMDEPENHLHPGALVEVLDNISRHIPNGQLWIATHSINVLAHFDPFSIWYIDQGKISYAGNVPQTVLDSLLGSEEEIEKLTSFLSLPANMASTQFAYESLFYPKVVLTGSHDPQINQISEIIEELRRSAIKLKILDYGIGKGRLISTIAENERLSGKNVSEWLDVYGFDIDPTNRDICLKTFNDVYNNSEKRYYNDISQLLVDHDEKSFDLIVMTNVLHEVDPKEWPIIFNSSHSAFKLLKEDGYLLVVEDQLLAVGEKAHSKGFLVLDSLELKELFKITSSDKYQFRDAREDGRLKAHFIPANCLNRVDSSSRRKALDSLVASAKRHILRIRTMDHSFKNGKLHAFWAQQLANASLALEEL
jgi:ABC-type multidrug transport system ATPase subunit